MSVRTSEIIGNISKDHSKRYITIIDGKEIVAVYNQNGGISVGENTLVISGKIMNAEWELMCKDYTFMEAINSGKRIKPKSWDAYQNISETLYDVLGLSVDKVLGLINGAWNIEGL